jgi:predicted HicB family RNase H-like nuclease
MTQEEIKAHAARYTKIVEWNDEDQCFIGRCPEVMLGGIHGGDEAKVYAELCDAVEEMIKLIHSDGEELPESLSGKKFSGKFVLRVEPAIHRRLTAKALAAGESLNTFCVKMLSKPHDIRNTADLRNTNLPLAMARQQDEVFELLRGLSTEHGKFHEWYQSAIQVLNSESPDRLSQAANSIRELCDKLPDRIANIPKFNSPVSPVKSLQRDFLEAARSYKTGWKDATINGDMANLLLRLEKIFKTFNEPPRSARLKMALTQSDPQAESLSKEYRDARDDTFDSLGVFFQDVTHHKRQVGELDFRKEVELFESLLLNYLTPCTATQQNELLSLIAGPPKPEALARVYDLISHKGANYFFFFDKLDNPSWLQPLEKGGHFANLPGPEPTADGRVAYRVHVPLIALTKLAEKAPNEVTDILLRLKLPDNSRIGDQVLQCISQIRDVDCIKKLPPLIEKFADNSPRTSWLWVQELLKSWLGLEVYPEILIVIRAYLNSAVIRSQSRETDTWLTRQIDEGVLATLTARYPFEIAEIVFKALARWCKFEREKYDESQIADDVPGSYMVEDFKIPPLLHRGVEATLARRLFLAGEQIYRLGNSTLIDKLDQLLRSNPWQLFRRLRCQLYAEFPATTLEQARTEVLQRISFVNEIGYGGSHDYEFAQLLIVHAKHHGHAFLSEKEVERFATTVFKGPFDHDGNLLEGNNVFFYRKQLWPIASLLHGEHLAEYRKIVPDDSAIDIESYKPFRSSGVSGGFVASVAPKESKSLELMADKDLWMFLNTWEDNEGYQRDSSGKLYHANIFALANEFADLTEKLPQRFDPSKKWWQNITRWEIINKFLDRATDRISKKENAIPTEMEWDGWFGLVEWVMGQSWPKDSVSRFLRNALQSDYVISDRFISKLPKLIRQLIEEPDTRLSVERSFGDELTTAINSIRGETMETLLYLANREKNTGREIDAWIFEFIRSRLELPDESPAIFALFGSRLRFFVHLFDKELKKFPDLLFPPERHEHRDAAVIAHFTYDQPWDRTIQVLPNLINTALETLETIEADIKQDEKKKDKRDFASRLGTHICCYYWWSSFLSGKEGENAVDKFFELASSDTRSMVISQIASIWERGDKEPQDKKVIAKVMNIWERRYAQIEKHLNDRKQSHSEYYSELAESVDLLGCECFPFMWRFNYTKLALEKLEKAPRAYGLLKTIIEFSTKPERLESMLDLLHALLKRPNDELRWSIQPKEITPMIRSGLASNRPTTVKLARGCKDLLLRFGFSDFLKVGDGEIGQS